MYNVTQSSRLVPVAEQNVHKVSLCLGDLSASEAGVSLGGLGDSATLPSSSSSSSSSASSDGSSFEKMKTSDVRVNQSESQFR